ncbi:MAG: phosphatidylserine decarboxylase [Azospirillum sp.]|nr:phosphatidylserine decarboxylase [Azospirillum sp.]MCA3268323.1 phosphatidylserine decarboxylase [Azospirillum sp.]
MSDMWKSVAAPIHKAGVPFVAGGLVGTFLLGWVWGPLAAVGAVVTLWIAYFFRDPDRTIPTREGLVVSPADGMVQLIVDAVPPPELDMGDRPRPRISIFLNVFDVHVNRVPMGGTVARARYQAGRFHNAALDKASDENERMSIRVTMEDGRDVGFVQIAGLVARRILCDLREGQAVRTGERYGLIRFGSRCDVYLPEGVSPMVCVGQRAIGGETVLADLASGEAPRRGEVR